jgi:hypothetical protein
MAQKSSKRDQMRQGALQARAPLSEENLQHLKKGLVGSKVPFKKALFTMEQPDLEWIEETVATLQENRRRTTKSELIKVGVALMKEKSLDDLRELLRRLD